MLNDYTNYTNLSYSNQNKCLGSPLLEAPPPPWRDDVYQWAKPPNVVLYSTSSRLDFFSGAQSATARDARVVGRWLLAMHYSLALLSLSTRARAPSAFVYVLKLKLRLLRFHKISNIFSFDTSRLFLAVRKLIIFHENLCVPGAGQAGPLSHRNGNLPYGNFLFYVRFSGTCRKD